MLTNPVIIQFDDDENYFTVADLFCYNLNLTISRKINSIEKAKTLVKEIESKKLIPDIAIVSNFLEKDLSDGEKICARLKVLVPGIKIIAYTTDKEDQWADYWAVKSSKNTDESLIKILSDLTSQKFKSTNAQ